MSAQPYESTGRIQQKSRTRAALLDAARALLAEEATPTVEDAAERAGISRTTAYRYFGNRRELLAATYPMIELPSLLGDDAPADPEERLDAVTEQLGRLLLDHEPELRTQLRLSLETGDEDRLPLRRGRAIGWIEEALSPLSERMPRREVHGLAIAIRAAVGIEPLVWLTDIAGLSRERAVDVMRSTARALLREAVGVHAGG